MPDRIIPLFQKKKMLTVWPEKYSEWLNQRKNIYLLRTFPQIVSASENIVFPSFFRTSTADSRGNRKLLNVSGAASRGGTAQECDLWSIAQSTPEQLSLDLCVVVDLRRTDRHSLPTSRCVPLQVHRRGDGATPRDTPHRLRSSSVDSS